MNSSIWGYMFLVLGLFGLFLVNMFGEITINDEQNYYSLKEVTRAAMIDAVDEYDDIKDEMNLMLNSSNNKDDNIIYGFDKLLSKKYVIR